MEEWYITNIGAIESSRQFTGSTGAKVLLINRIHIVKQLGCDLDATYNWYLSNNCSPEVIAKDDNYIVYQYIKESGVLTVDKIKQFINNYAPQKAILDQSYSQDMFDLYVNLCTKHNLDVIKLNLPKFEEGYNLHGDLGLHNLIVTDEKAVFIDPEPLVGVYAHDILQFYFSDPTIINMVDIDLIKNVCDKSEFEFLYPIQLIMRLERSSRHHPQDLQFYRNLYHQYIKKTRD